MKRGGPDNDDRQAPFLPTMECLHFLALKDTKRQKPTKEKLGKSWYLKTAIRRETVSHS